MNDDVEHCLFNGKECKQIRKDLEAARKQVAELEEAGRLIVSGRDKHEIMWNPKVEAHDFAIGLTKLENLLGPK